MITCEPQLHSLVVSNLDLVRRLARRLRRKLPRYAELEELEADGYVALVEAAQLFDASRGVPFRGYANWRIKWAMLDGMRMRNQVRRGQRQPQIQSLSTLVRSGSGSQVTLEQLLEAPQEPGAAKLEMLDEAERILKELTLIERQRLFDIYVHGKQQTEIARQLKISTSAVSQQMRTIHRRVDQIRHRLHPPRPRRLAA
jgi:RNA polymerase sigma factor (sigma-70 family)